MSALNPGRLSETSRGPLLAACFATVLVAMYCCVGHADLSARLVALEAEKSTLGALVVAAESEKSALSARVVALEVERSAFGARVDLLERAFTSLVGKQLVPAASAPAEASRRLDEATEDRATVRIDAPSGVAELVLGGESAADNVVLSKAHASDGANFTLSRGNDTGVLSVGVDGTMSVLADPLYVPSGVAAAPGAQLELRSASGAGVVLQDQQTTDISEVDGTAEWSSAEVLVYCGDTVRWTWTNYHNVVEVNDAGIIVAGGVRSGDPELSSSFAHTFVRPGLYLFKSQADNDMRMKVEVREFAVRDGTMFVGGDLQVGNASSAVDKGTLRVGGSLEVGGELKVGGVAIGGPTYENEIKMFLANECPTGWTEATELGGYLLMGRTPGGQVNATKNRPMGASEDGRMHSTVWKSSAASFYMSSSSTAGNAAYGSGYDFVSGYYSSIRYYWNKLRSPTYQTSTYMEPIGEYYPFASVLLCKRA
mmetsp:Transcript_18043/g.30681  ORF Transcript_18043/g.30681 Transcript_18043/m.30681 type:complete len:483 (-) Transcript_18043:502-1950(-)|eukprot:CAMPEP_0206154304 /NCGR_PEP_ID=MMETSP1474-20131121/1272_1 /ASSEMBLY_ACC=CAM_ASM_001110 /TAXON_ID=97495 /ORGANISM="Imantonia sp., Strain RCC918" /LENGTH=482 /DNA_ID=CAMNT_0053552457 /DNA_START=22 /DNA_END=1470 /DNA_ORIENTATION=+